PALTSAGWATSAGPNDRSLAGTAACVENARPTARTTQRLPPVLTFESTIFSTPPTGRTVRTLSTAGSSSAKADQASGPLLLPAAADAKATVNDRIHGWTCTRPPVGGPHSSTPALSDTEIVLWIPKMLNR